MHALKPPTKFVNVPDRGPIYTETLRHEAMYPNSWLVEPYNAATAALFIVVAVYWLYRVQGPPRDGFLTYSAAVLAVGGIGGTLYHALRTHVVFLILDVLPILLLAVSAVYWFIFRMAKTRSVALVYTLGGLIAIGATVRVVRTFVPIDHAGPLVGYGMLGLFVTVPMLTFVARTRFRHAQWVALALLSFAGAMTFRALDGDGLLPIGTHFLWHSLGALMTHLLLLYVWRVRDVEVGEIST